MSDEQISAIANLERAIEVYNACHTGLPVGYSLSIQVPMKQANLIKSYFDELNPLGAFSVAFAAGEWFQYKGIRCIATPEK